MMCIVKILLFKYEVRASPMKNFDFQSLKNYHIRQTFFVT